MTITIIGLGPGDPDLLTRKAWRVLSESPEIWLRTARHPGIDELPASAAWHSFDDWYDRAQDFDTLYRMIAAEVVTLGARVGGVVYAVPGHPLVGETTVTHILTLAAAQNIPVTIIDGLSFIEPTFAALGYDGMRGVQIQDAIDVAALHHPLLNPDQPAILAQLYSLAIASDVKLTLMNQYPEEHPVTLIHGAGTPARTLETIPLHELDHSKQINHLTSLYVPPLAQAGSFERFQETIAHLRAPEGCPWDREQTHLSLRKYLLEETYEVLEAIDNEDTAALIEELGDLLLQVVLHTQIAIDEGEFRMADVIETVNSKMIRRHPHVWADVKVDGAAQVLKNWEGIKKQEKAAKGETAAAPSLMDNIPPALPALMLADKYSARAARVGFDWPDVDSVIAKVMEEIEEVKVAKTDADRAAELGDVLFSVANWARKYGVDPETALRQTCAKWARRFRYVEQHAGGDLSNVPLERMEALWSDAKQHDLLLGR